MYTYTYTYLYMNKCAQECISIRMYVVAACRYTLDAVCPSCTAYSSGRETRKDRCCVIDLMMVGLQSVKMIHLASIPLCINSLISALKASGSSRMNAEDCTYVCVCVYV
jgi:hypothetical protein